MSFVLRDRYLGEAGCLSALLRVLRPSASPFTYAKRSGNQLSAAGFAGLEASCLGALLRVPRASRSSLTCAKRPGNQLGTFVNFPRDITYFAAMGAVCPTQRSEGGARRAGDMSGVGYAAPMASPATDNAPMASPATDGFENQAQQFKLQSIELTPE